ncbi:MAG: hydantoinase/oxoprolinase family protein, partial [Bacillota bacterium]|nr:hydantoinase/oxoprolinase family protein [Bacillota bacterium]
MNTALGIDTGGTFTDAVIINLENNMILAKAKALTTRHNLAIGITEAVDKLMATELSQVSLVALSTTLATNAIVEGKGCEVGLILIGSMPDKKIPTSNVIVVAGGHNIEGVAKAELDIEEVKKAIMNLKPKVNAFAVSGYLSVRNPAHELAVKELIKELTDYPVVCAHQLTTTLGFHERTVTATLNARLLPIIADLVAAMEDTMKSKGIAAPLMIVKGDGTLISQSVAKDRPIETLLSGPAASLIGARELNEHSSCVVADMGGTTTDIAIINDNKLSINKEGALVGGWLTRVQAADIATVGVGGDSYITINEQGEIMVGPQKVYPIAWLAEANPNIVEELQEIRLNRFNPLFAQATDVYVFVKEPSIKLHSEVEQQVIALLKEAPHTLYKLSKILNKDANLFSLDKLIEMGVLMKASVTPTDILHSKGELALWNGEAAAIAVAIQAKRAGLPVDDFCDKVHDIIANKIALIIFEKLINEKHRRQGKQLLKMQYCNSCKLLIEDLLNYDEAGELINLATYSQLPLVAIGAPVKAYFPLVAKKLGAKLEIPKHAEVANAIGAAAGNVVEKVEILVQQSSAGGYAVHTPWSRKWFSFLGEATSYCIEKGKEYVVQKAE